MVLPICITARPAWDVPSKLDYCGLELQLDDSARSVVGTWVDKLTRYPKSFQSMLAKVDFYMPFVEEGLEKAGVPEDLKYLVILESSCQPDVVSSSQAVGFWQFKAESAREAGLLIDSQIDERMHIFHATMGAARYLQRLNRDFDNWFYAVIAYNRGPAGAKPFVDPSYFGKREMKLTGKTQVYGLKALAYKIAFRDHLGTSVQTQWLKPEAGGGETSLAELSERYGIDEATLRKYNAWIRGNSIPQRDNTVVYVLQQGAPQHMAMRHDFLNGQAVAVKDPVRIDKSNPAMNPIPDKGLDSKKYQLLADDADPEMGNSYLRALKGQNLVEIAVKAGVKTEKLRIWNGMDRSNLLQGGEIVYLKPPKKRKFHIVVAGQNMAQIAEIYGMGEEKLREKNRLGREPLVAGMKLHLKSTRSAKEKMQVLGSAPANTLNANPPVRSKPAHEEVAPAKPLESPSNNKIHTVSSGETLFGLAKRYSTTVDDLKKANQLRSDQLYVGQKIRIPSEK
jgi:membrane-bound lytic murein transglycosylase D